MGVTDTDATSLTLPISALRKEEGATVTVQRTASAPQRMGPEMIAIAAGAPVELDLVLLGTAEGVYVTGTIAAPTTGTCSRCLADITGDFSIAVEELFTFPERAAELARDLGEDADDFDPGYVLTPHDTLDLTEFLTDEAGLELPFSPDCSSVMGRPCAGPAEAGEAVAVYPATAAGEADTAALEPEVDPRWAGLKNLQVEQ